MWRLRWIRAALALLCVAAMPAVAWPLPDSDIKTGSACRATTPADGRVTPVAVPVTGTDVVDASTGLSMSIRSGNAGNVDVRATGHGLDVYKSVRPDGTYSVRVAGNGDSVVVVSSTSSVAVSRGKRSARLDLTRREKRGGAEAAQLLAGSPALSLFRAAVGRLSPAVRRTPAGVALVLTDIALRVLQGDPDAVERLRADGQLGEARPVNVAYRMRDCWGSFEGAVIDAWSSYVGCVYDFEWYSPWREVCSMVWLLRAESAWAQFLGCSIAGLR
jgi:hypothetical protein